jgi:hypothetical protein
MFWDGGLNSRRAHEPTRARVFYGASICPIFGIARPHTRRLHALHTRAIVQPFGSMCPFRLRAWSSPCVRIHRLGAEILPMESRRTSPNGADPIQRSSPRRLGCSSICIKKTWCDAATRPSDAFRYGYAPGDPALEPFEQRLAARPSITVPSIVLQGEGDGSARRPRAATLRRRREA